MRNVTINEFTNKLFDCSRNNVFCAYEFIIWTCEDKPTFEFVMSMFKKLGISIDEFYFITRLYQKEHLDLIMRFLTDYFKVCKHDFGPIEVMVEAVNISKTLNIIKQ